MQKYDFRKKLLQVHKKDIRDYSLTVSKNELEIKDGARIVIPKDASDVIITAVWDFCDYLFTSQGVSARIVRGCPDDGEIYVGTKKEIEADLKNVEAYKGFLVDVSEEKILVCGFDDRGAAQGLYFLENEMSRRRAPYLERKETRRKPLFSPRMLHSGYGLDEYPDAHLSAIAHSGRDAILVFVSGVNMTPGGFSDFNNLIYRAEKYGIDVYAYSYLKGLTHPDDEDADAVFEATYGELFKNCPGFRGVTLVGESVQFASRDEHVCDLASFLAADSSAIPDSRPKPGWWPCDDYCKWIAKVRNTVRKYKHDADVVFWTYNWAWAPEDERLKLIRSLPADISLLVTFEMAQQFRLENVVERCDDYTLSFTGPGAYFLSEAEEAKKCGIRLYSMTNTGGLTWDMGTIPYEPMPYQWMRRYEGILEAHEKYNLCGLMESHHYGFYPSFIGELSNLCLSDTEKSMEAHLHDILEKYYGKENVELLELALKNWSDAIQHFVPSQDDQYGPFRVGPAYPFLFADKPEFRIPAVPHAHFGNKIVSHYYGRCDSVECLSLKNRIERCVLAEKRSFERALDYWKKGIDILSGISDANEELSSLLNLGQYIMHTITTGINAKRWFIAKNKLERVTGEEVNPDIFRELEKILDDECENAKATISVVDKDSRLGWEPSMDYIGHSENIQWKLRQLEYVRNVQLQIARKRFGDIERYTFTSGQGDC